MNDQVLCNLWGDDSTHFFIYRSDDTEAVVMIAHPLHQVCLPCPPPPLEHQVAAAALQHHRVPSRHHPDSTPRYVGHVIPSVEIVGD